MRLETESKLFFLVHKYCAGQHAQHDTLDMTFSRECVEHHRINRIEQSLAKRLRWALVWPDANADPPRHYQNPLVNKFA